MNMFQQKHLNFFLSVFICPVNNKQFSPFYLPEIEFPEKDHGFMFFICVTVKSRW